MFYTCQKHEKITSKAHIPILWIIILNIKNIQLGIAGGSIDKSWSKTKTKLEIEYFHQISEIIESNISRFQTIFEIEYKPKASWGITLGLVNEYYTENQNNFRTNPTNIFISINKFGFIN